MEILGSIQGEDVEVTERERMQREMRGFIGKLQKTRGWKSERIAYKVHFSRPLLGRKVDSLIEFRAAGEETWYARANGADAWKAFCRAMVSLKQIVTEMEMREESHAKDDGDIA
jgi:ribosome-associated translation inhibitor RaiA